MTMTPERHYREAERLLASVTPAAIAKEGVLGDVHQHVAQRLAEAQVHATLALYRPAHKAYRNPPDNSVYEGEL